jgi:hypothetical protein
MTTGWKSWLVLTAGLGTFALECAGATALWKRWVEVDPDRDRRTVCELHQVKMRVRLAPIRYGFAMPGEPDEGTVRASLFPNEVHRVGGGCVYGPARFAQVRSCPRCERARAAWNEEHARRVAGI